jgi:hypothetical protein
MRKRAGKNDSRPNYSKQKKRSFVNYVFLFLNFINTYLFGLFGSFGSFGSLLLE